MTDGQDKQDQTNSKLTKLLAGLNEEETRRDWEEERVDFTFNLESVTSGRFAYIREIGAGGMGRVLLAHDGELERDVAVKVLEVPAVNENDVTVARFIREAKITAGLVHPGIVPVYDLGHTPDGHHFFIMQVVEGITLHEMLARAKMDGVDRVTHVSHLLQVFLSVCQAMSYAHHKEVMHLDLKPGNIMEGAFGEVLVMDWGVAKRVAELASEARSSGDTSGSTPVGDETTGHKVLGTPGFMAPEQYLGDPGAISPAADVFALGVILFTILTGEKPYQGSTLGEIQLAVRTGRRRSVQEAVQHADQKSVPQELAAICEKALATNPEERYATAIELGADIQAYIENRAISAFRENLSRRIRRWLRRHQAASAAIMSGLCTLLLGLCVWSAHTISLNHYLRDFRRQINARREAFDKATRKAHWLQRQQEHTPKEDAERQQELSREIRKGYRRQRLAAQQLRSAISALLAAQRTGADTNLCRELRELWLAEMDLGIRGGYVDYVQHSFARMQEERGRLPWWNWEPREFHKVDRIRSWLKIQGAAPEDAYPEEESVPEEGTEDDRTAPSDKADASPAGEESEQSRRANKNGTTAGDTDQPD